MFAFNTKTAVKSCVVFHAYVDVAIIGSAIGNGLLYVS